MESSSFALMMVFLLALAIIPLVPEAMNHVKRKEIRQWVLAGKFIPAEDFERNLVFRGKPDRYGRYPHDEPGCYVILIFKNPVKNGDYSGYWRGYVGQSVHVYSRINEHLNGSHRMEIHRDYRSGKRLYISIIPCKGNLDDLETSLIRSLDWSRLYNQKKGDGRIRSLNDLNGSVGKLVNGRKANGIAVGDPVLKKGETIKDVMQKASEGNRKAQFKLGFFYEHGICVPKDEGKAIMWYHRAVKNGHPEAARKLSSMYKEGRGVKKNDAKAKELMEKAKLLSQKQNDIERINKSPDDNGLSRTWMLW